MVQMPTFILERQLRSGELVTVLPDHEPPPLSLYAIYPPGRPLAAKVRSFIDFVAATFTDRSYWDAGGERTTPARRPVDTAPVAGRWGRSRFRQAPSRRQGHTWVTRKIHVTRKWRPSTVLIGCRPIRKKKI